MDPAEQPTYLRERRFDDVEAVAAAAAAAVPILGGTPAALAWFGYTITKGAQLVIDGRGTAHGRTGAVECVRDLGIALAMVACAIWGLAVPA